MAVQLVRASADDTIEIHAMQIEAFAGLPETYQEYDTSPGAESVEKVRARLEQGWTYFYFIIADGEKIGAIRVVDPKNGDAKRISPLFIQPAYRNRGYAQQAIREAERLHGSENWSLGTIKQEKGNCHLYEKMGYHLSGTETIVNDKMTIIGYEK